MDSIDTAEIDVDSIDADGEIPMRTITTLHLHGDFQESCETYMGIDEPDGKYGNKLVFILHNDVAAHLHAELSKLLYG
jgi:hypothetical protein